MKNRQDNYLAQRDNTVVKANELIQKSRYNLNVQQQKILLYLISQVSPFDTDFQEYEFNIIEFCKVCGIDYRQGKNYQDIKNAIKDIADRSIWITLDTGEETLLRWIEKPYINKKGGLIRIRLDNDMKPYLIELKKNFTKIELVYTLAMKSKYSIRLYEIIKSVHYDEQEEYTRRYKLDDLKKMLGAEHYTIYRDFHARVLKIAVSEINQYTDKEVSYRPITESRSTIGIEFIIKTKDISERILIREKIDKELGTDQISFYDFMNGENVNGK